MILPMNVKLSISIMIYKRMCSAVAANVLLSSIPYLSCNTVDANQLQKITLLAFSTYLAIE